MNKRLVFVSYFQGSQEKPVDGPLAKQLKEMINETFGPESCELAPLLTKEATAIPEHLAEMIEAAQYFVVIIPEMKSSWVDQEIGYAYSRARVGTLKMIVVYRREDRSDIEGFISKGSHHLAADFRLADKPEETWEKVIAIITKDRIFPLDIYEVSYQRDEYSPKVITGDVPVHEYNLVFNLGIENTTGIEIEGGTIDFIMPFERKGLSEIIPYLETSDFLTSGFHPLLKHTYTNRQGRTDGESVNKPLSMKSTSLPPHIDNYIEVNKKEVPYAYRKSFFMEKIHPQSRIEIPFEAFIKYKNQEQDCEVHFGIYLQVPRFGVRIYEILIRSKVENPVGRIGIHDRDKARISIN